MFGLKNQVMHWESRESPQDRAVNWFGVVMGGRGAKQTSLKDDADMALDWERLEKPQSRLGLDIQLADLHHSADHSSHNQKSNHFGRLQRNHVAGPRT